jgi:hypothetical protein
MSSQEISDYHCFKRYDMSDYFIVSVNYLTAKSVPINMMIFLNHHFYLVYVVFTIQIAVGTTPAAHLPRPKRNGRPAFFGEVRYGQSKPKVKAEGNQGPRRVGNEPGEANYLDYPCYGYMQL